MSERLLRLVLAAWAGSLWTVCGLVAPSLFAILPERQLAGELAGHFFRVVTWLGLLLGSGALVLILLRKMQIKSNVILVLVTALSPLASELVLRPLMDAARAAGNMARFGMLHGVSAVLFGVACVTAAVLVWRAPYASGKTIRG